LHGKTPPSALPRDVRENGNEGKQRTLTIGVEKWGKGGQAKQSDSALHSTEEEEKDHFREKGVPALGFDSRAERRECPWTGSSEKKGGVN